MNRTGISASLGSEWDQEQGLIFVYNAALGGRRGVISIGYPTRLVADHFSRLEFYNGDFHLATSNGRVVVQSKLKGTRIDVRNGAVSVDTVDDVNGDLDRTAFHSCKSDDGELSHLHVKPAHILLLKS